MFEQLYDLQIERISPQWKTLRGYDVEPAILLSKTVIGVRACLCVDTSTRNMAMGKLRVPKSPSEDLDLAASHSQTASVPSLI